MFRYRRVQEPGRWLYITLPPDGNGGSGLINPGLYKIGADPQRYANDFYDITVGNNTADPGVPATLRRKAGTRSPGSGHPMLPTSC